MQTPSPWASKADIDAAREVLKADIDGLHANLTALHEDLRAVRALLTELRDRQPWWRRLFTAGAVVAAVMSVSVGARGSGAYMDGNDLYGFCASSGTFQKCSGYIEAVADAYSPINAYIACEPPSIPAGQSGRRRKAVSGNAPRAAVQAGMVARYGRLGRDLPRAAADRHPPTTACAAGCAGRWGDDGD